MPLDYKKNSGGGRIFLPRFFKLGLGCLGWSLPGFVAAAAQSTTAPPSKETTQEIINQILAFIYSLGHLIGEGFVKLLNTILPSVPVPTELIDPIGLLSILTIFLAVAAVAKKLVWIIVIAGWALIIIRLIIVIVQNYV